MTIVNLSTRAPQAGRKPRSRLVAHGLGALAAAIFMIPAQSAQASCVYNHADHDVVLAIYTESHGVYHWTVKKKEHRCNRGHGGTLVKDKLRIHVRDHGWVSISESPASYREGPDPVCWTRHSYDLTFTAKYSHHGHTHVADTKTCIMKDGICDYYTHNATGECDGKAH